MAEALGLAASVIAIIDLSAKIASQCCEYYANVENARDDIERLQREAEGLKATLEQVQSLCDSPNGAKLQSSQNLSDGVKDCKKQLAQLETKLEPRTRHKVMSRFGMRALKWPLKSSEVEEIMTKLGNCKDNISFSLQVDQAYVIMCTFHVEQKLTMLSTGYKFLASIRRSFLTDYGLPTTPRSTPTPKSTMPDAIKALEFSLFNRYIRGPAI